MPRQLVMRAIGPQGRNLRQMSEILGKRIRVIQSPRGIVDVKGFFGAVVHPVIFKDLEVKDNEIIINAGSQSKAALIGRNKRRLLELQKTAKSYFGKELKIV